MFDESQEPSAQKNEYTGQQNSAYNFFGHTLTSQESMGSQTTHRFWIYIKYSSNICIFESQPSHLCRTHFFTSDSWKLLLQIQGGECQSCCKDCIEAPIERICKAPTHIQQVINKCELLCNDCFFEKCILEFQTTDLKFHKL